MSFKIPSTPAEWEVLNQRIHSHYNSSISRPKHVIIWLVTIIGPVPAILYLISAVKRCQTNGWWLVKVDERGYLYPHTRVMLTFWVVTFTLVNLAHSISLLLDCQSHLHPRTLICHFASFAPLACFGWAKVWSLFYAMPPSRYRLAQANQKSGSSYPPQSMKRPIPACLFNPLIITAHLMSLFGTLPWLFTAIRESYTVLSSYDRYQSSYASLLDPNSTPVIRLESQLQALLSVKNMVQSMEAIRRNLKNACIFMVIVAIIQLISLIWCSHRILGALYFQAKFLRKAASRQIDLEIQAAQVDFEWCGSSEPSNPTKISPASPAHSICGSVRSMPDKMIFVSHWKEYLPSLDRGNKVSARLWNSGPFQKTQEQIIGDGLKDMSFFYRKLRRYAINTFWHIVLAALVKLSYIILCILLILGAFDHLAILHFEVAIFQWVNITWNCGVGFILGIVSCVVVFTPTPTLPREPDVWEGEADITDEVRR
ncbi:uncharacterized protein PGTG_08553 [Puccinia graminis f. sp. tritici CRL 75-36-700-3]|uniref:Uncharacterized protein n=1 Tax=Puccinia graminis f. sp. tritici (strain CRL 75-36-700-3 / race SCCL) TaxID=418459 RepID=E3KGE2_PUCGT|nr:uncharacterized protein PGTG_08553 [Puccinia graminis f. sp. tritici CRL 75-36-700-3]EFP83367.2 hypothetical protein PGTG_08553 [Puccinia graminis f. sp. tritici CRL 75-36-700-3]